MKLYTIAFANTAEEVQLNYTHVWNQYMEATVEPQFTETTPSDVIDTLWENKGKKAHMYVIYNRASIDDANCYTMFCDINKWFKHAGYEMNSSEYNNKQCNIVFQCVKITMDFNFKQEEERVEQMLINVFYEIPVVDWNDVHTKETEAFDKCYDSIVKPEYIIKSVKQIQDSIANSCSQNIFGIYITVESPERHNNHYHDFINQIIRFLAINHPEYILETYTGNTKSRFHYTRLAIKLGSY